MLHSLLLHVNGETLVEPAGLTLVPPGDVHHTPAIVFTEIVQSPAAEKCWQCLGRSSRPTHPAASRRILLLKNPLQPSQEGTP